MNGFLKAAELLPPSIRRAAQALPDAEKRKAEELRLRLGYLPTVLLPDGEREIPDTLQVTSADIATVLEIATAASAHTAQSSLARGFVTANGGCRVGLGGAAIMSTGGITGLHNYSSAAIRVPREFRGCADVLYSDWLRGGLCSTLIISPPGGGKTSLLRELVRKLSEDGRRVALADERFEIAGTPGKGFDVGRRTDVISGAPKSESVTLLLRAMNPELIALDEVTAPEDARAVDNACGCGVRVLATAHAENLADLGRRRLYQEMFRRELFERVIIISRSGGARRYELVEP